MANLDPLVSYFDLKVADATWQFLLRNRGSRNYERQRSTQIALKNSLNRQATQVTLKEVGHGMVCLTESHPGLNSRNVVSARRYSHRVPLCHHN